MSPFRIRKILGYTLIVAWLTWGVDLLVLPPKMAEAFISSSKLVLAESTSACKKIDCSSFAESTRQLEAWIANPSEVAYMYWAYWVTHLVAILLGIGAAFMLLHGTRRWALAILITSLVYFWQQGHEIEAAFHILFRGIDTLEQFAARLAVFAKYPGSSLTMLYYNLLVPLLLLSACAIAIRSDSPMREAPNEK